MSDDKEGQGEDKGAKKEPKLDSKGSFNLKASKLLRRSRSNDSENHYRESRRGREQDRKQDVKRPRGRSEERRRPHYDPEPNNPEKEQATDDLEDLECIVCFCNFDNVFKAPKLLSCGHTFCLECLARINVNSAELKTLTCPICREPTEIRHGRDLPHLGNNEDIFRKLPPDMQRVLSVRFQRSKGKLVLKKNSSGPVKTTLNIPVFKKKEEQVPNYPLEAMEEGLGSATMINVGRPPSRMRSHMRRFLYSNQCYYTTVAGIIAVTVALMLVGIFTFVIMPHVRPVGNSNITPTERP
ncbi:E3 ubiquitin-protein ligase RNF183 [Paramisgurnus dabryanus]|uniref:E3 ubiquitin-protein ligase RNF183 n=1 Tax=Paramisgurnus dabryanus TaxID=90735 RepID=UPI0031F4091C